MIPDAAFAVLGAYLGARGAFSEADLDVIRAAFVYKPLAAGEFLQRAGEVARYAAFVATGCLRNYVIDPRGLIRFKWVGFPGTKAIDTALEELLKETESKNAP